MLINRKFVPFVTLLASLFLSSQSEAFFITSVNAPNLTRPSDGALYAFNILVSGKYTRDDLVLAGVTDALTVKAEYWDNDVFFNDEIDLTSTLTIPLNGAVLGGAWGAVPVSFKVGCTTDSVVYGPSGNSGENPMDDGYFRFTTGSGLTWTNHGSWGYNKVTCQSGATGGEPISSLYEYESNS